MTGDPQPRPGGTWPRDAPVDLPAVGRNVATVVLTTIAVLAQVVLALPVWLISHGLDGVAGGLAGPIIALAWGGLTLWAGWCWIRWRARGLLAPVATVALLWLAAVGGGPLPPD